jgi:hypothetical protein
MISDVPVRAFLLSIPPVSTAVSISRTSLSIPVLRVLPLRRWHPAALNRGRVVYLNGYWVAWPIVPHSNKPKLTQSDASPGSGVPKKRPRGELIS